MECQITKYCKMVEPMLDKGRDVALLGLRLVLAYGFYAPAMMKWDDIASVASWFESMGMPLPTLNAYLAASTELAGVILLTLGLATRLISIPLIVVMLVAIFMVHLPHGFSSGDNGFEIPLYYILMLFTLVTMGAGKLSVDHFIGNKK